MSVLERGGNAFDAAVRDRIRPAGRRAAPERRRAARCPRSSTPPVTRCASLCGQGVAPAAATIERFHELGHELVPGTGVLAACVPGAFGAWLLLLRELGTWRLADVLELAIGYAENGFPLVRGSPHDDRPHRGAARDLARLAGPVPARARGRRALPEPGTRRDLPPHRRREPRRVARGGDRARAPRVLRGLRRRGDRSLLARPRKGCSRATISRRWEADLRAGGRVRVSRAHGLQDGSVGYGAGRPAATRAPPGATTSPSSRRPSSSTSSPSARSLSFADRDALYGDADVRLDILLSEEYSSERRALVGEDASEEYRPGFGRLPRVHDVQDVVGSGEPSRGTVHLDVADRFGNMLSATPSGGWLQSSPVIPSLGWPLGTRAQMFWLEEGLPSSLRPGARPRTTLSPGLALRDGQAVPRLGNARRRPAGAVGAARVPAPRRPRARSPGSDRRARVPHRPPDLVLLPARLRAEVARARVARELARRSPISSGEATTSRSGRPGRSDGSRRSRASRTAC